MYCPVCKSFVSSLDDECRVCGKVLKTKKRSKNSKNKSKTSKINSKKRNLKSKNSKKKSKKKNKNKAKKLAYEIRKNKRLGGKTRQYNDRRNFEFSILGCYTIW